MFWAIVLQILEIIIKQDFLVHTLRGREQRVKKMAAAKQNGVIYSCPFKLNTAFKVRNMNLQKNAYFTPQKKRILKRECKQ